MYATNASAAQVKRSIRRVAEVPSDAERRRESVPEVVSMVIRSHHKHRVDRRIARLDATVLPSTPHGSGAPNQPEPL